MEFVSEKWLYTDARLDCILSNGICLQFGSAVGSGSVLDSLVVAMATSAYYQFGALFQLCPFRYKEDMSSHML